MSCSGARAANAAKPSCRGAHGHVRESIAARASGWTTSPGPASGILRSPADQTDQVHLAVHAELGVDGRQVITDGALAEEHVGGDGGDALAVEQAGEHRPLAAGELAELRGLGEDGQLVEPGNQSGRTQLVGYPWSAGRGRRA